ncbi:MAG TPA: hypothetical protein VG457_07770 [Planctomycetota bacterium]|jgi:hypothetical protein|nr:hypothetical protein [Planctomycetota bacterium]
MHCPSCNKTLAAGTKCPKCGKLAVASSVDEIDLMPMDEPKVAGAAAFHPPPEAFLPPPPMPGKGSKKKALAAPGEVPPMEEPLRIRAGALAPKASPTNKIIGGGVLLLLLLFIAWRMFRTENKVLGLDPTVPNKTFTVQPNQALLRNVEISGTVSWKFEVTATDDTVAVGVVHRSAKDPQTLAALKQLPDTTYELVKKGETHPMSGEFKTGTYSWVVLNENKKAVRVKVNFKAQP